MVEPVVVLLGRGRVPADTPLLRADDLGVLRGDGVFETTHVRDGQPWLLDEHLARMRRSADLLELDLPSEADLRELVDTACEGWPAEVEGAVRLVCTRGPESGGPVTVYATLNPVAPQLLETRRAGIAVVTGTLGISSEVRSQAPWLLGGAKALSYAVNMASQRWAREQSADDVLWTSLDGYALEGPTSNLLWLDGDELCTVPAAATGILPGITVSWVLGQAGRFGWRAVERMVRPADLLTMDGVWFTSSIRGVVPVRSLDGVALRPASSTAELQRLVGHPVAEH